MNKLTPDELYDLIYKAPGNRKANNTSIHRSGRQLLVYAPIDLEVLAKLINERFGA